MQILVVLGAGLIIYAVFGIFTSGKPKAVGKQKILDQQLPLEDSAREQKIQRLQSQITKLENQLEQAKVVAVEEKTGAMTAKEKETEFSTELNRRQEWVAKAEAELAKTRVENIDLNKKFILKENELQEEFSKNVNLTRQVQEIKTALEEKEMSCRLKEEQLQIQKHQSESQHKSISEHLATIAEFQRKEKISEWVPKQEFNQLNAEYTKLEKELETSQERLKGFASEIAHLRQAINIKAPLIEEIKLPEAIPETIPQENTASEGIKPQEVVSDEIKGEETENKTKETDDQK